MDATSERYAGPAGERYHRLKREIPGAAVPWVARHRARKFNDFIKPGDTVLEYGVGYGWNLMALECARKIGFDLTTFLAPEVQKHGIEFVPSTADLPGAVANVVICHHVLEHLLSPSAALSEIRRLLQPGGRLVLTVPSEKGSRGDRFNPDDPNHHLYTWTVPLLGNLVSDCGFEVLSAKQAVYGYDRFAATLALRWKAGEFGFRVLRRSLQLLRPLYEVQLLGSPRPTRSPLGE